MGRRVHVEADDVFDLRGEGRIVRALEGADAVGLQMVGFPDALDGAQRLSSPRRLKPTRFRGF